jgi:mRNA-degrading endonuclease toxin of MazEF toxin-antitoxin module
MVGPPCCGQIVWVDIADANGIYKARPAVVITPDEKITPDGLFEVVAVTSALTDPLPDDHVLLPWHAQGHPRTGLNRKCAAVCSWMAQVAAKDVQSVAGKVPTAY